MAESVVFYNLNISRVQVVMKNRAKVCHAYPNLKPNVVFVEKASARLVVRKFLFQFETNKFLIAQPVANWCPNVRMTLKICTGTFVRNC